MKTNLKSNQQKELLSRPEQSVTTERPVIDLAKRQINRAMELEALLRLLKTNHPNILSLAEVVGKWVWVAFAEKQPVEVTSTMSQLGFHWNKPRQVWQHPCGTIQTERRQSDPRKRYGAHSAADEIAA